VVRSLRCERCVAAPTRRNSYHWAEQIEERFLLSGWAIWAGMKSSWCAVRASVAWSTIRAFCSGGIGCRRIRSSSICSSGRGAGGAIDGAGFGSRCSMSAAAAIVRSRGWSGWWWRGVKQVFNDELLDHEAAACTGSGTIAATQAPRRHGFTFVC